MGLARLSGIGPEQPVPPWQIEAEVAVRLTLVDRVMDTVHVRSHHDPPKGSIERHGDPHVAVVEQRRGIEHDFEDEHRDGRGPEGEYNAELEAHREQDLNGMEAKARSHVELEIRVVHPVHTPQGRDRVEHHVLQVDGEIKSQDREDEGEPPGRLDSLEQAPATFFGDQGQSHGQNGKSQADQHRIEHHDRDVIRPA